MSEGLGLNEPFRLGKAKQKVENDKSEEPDKEKNVPNPPGWQKVNEKMGDRYSNGSGNDQEQGEDEGCPNIEVDPASKGRGVSRKNGQAEEQHHPGGIEGCRGQARVEEGG